MKATIDDAIKCVDEMKTKEEELLDKLIDPPGFIMPIYDEQRKFRYTRIVAFSEVLDALKGLKEE